MSEIDTEVRGDTGAVTAAADWIRSFGTDGAGVASDKAAQARKLSFDLVDGAAGGNYRDVVEKVYDESTSLEEPAKRAAQIVDEYAHQLQALKDAMARIRTIAAAGHLQVSGNFISQPPLGVPAEAWPGFEYAGDDPVEKQRLAGQFAAQVLRLFEELRGDVHDNRETFRDWVEANLRPMVEYLGGEDYVGFRGGLGPVGRFGVDFSFNLGKDAFGAAAAIPKLARTAVELSLAAKDIDKAYDHYRDTGDDSQLKKVLVDAGAGDLVDDALDAGKANPAKLVGGSLAKTLVERTTQQIAESEDSTGDLPPRPSQAVPDYE